MTSIRTLSVVGCHAAGEVGDVNVGRLLPSAGRRCMARWSRCSAVGDAAGRYAVDWRTAALAVAVARVAEAARLRAVYP